MRVFKTVAINKDGSFSSVLVPRDKLHCVAYAMGREAKSIIPRAKLYVFREKYRAIEFGEDIWDRMSRIVSKTKGFAVLECLCEENRVKRAKIGAVWAPNIGSTDFIREVWRLERLSSSQIAGAYMVPTLTPIKVVFDSRTWINTST